jgi:transcription initiation factor TFIIE subunit beta
MGGDLQKQKDAFTEALKRQPVFEAPALKRASSPSLSTASVASSSSAASSQIINGRPINSYVHAIITQVKAAERPVSFDEINSRLNINLHQHSELLDKVLRNERVSFDPQSSTLNFESTFTVRNKDDILALLRMRPNGSGVLMSELKDAHPKAEEMLSDLVQQKEIFLIRGKDDGPRVAFLNDDPNTSRLSKTPIDAEFLHLWNSIAVPDDEQEVRVALENAGMKTLSKFTIGSNARNELGFASADSQPSLHAGRIRKAPGAKKPFRRIKITNDYLEGIDLNLDPSVN